MILMMMSLTERLTHDLWILFQWNQLNAARESQLRKVNGSDVTFRNESSGPTTPGSDSFESKYWVWKPVLPLEPLSSTPSSPVPSPSASSSLPLITSSSPAAPRVNDRLLPDPNNSAEDAKKRIKANYNKILLKRTLLHPLVPAPSTASSTSFKVLGTDQSVNSKPITVYSSRDEAIQSFRRDNTESTADRHSYKSFPIPQDDFNEFVAQNLKPSYPVIKINHNPPEPLLTLQHPQPTVNTNTYQSPLKASSTSYSNRQQPQDTAYYNDGNNPQANNFKQHHGKVTWDDGIEFPSYRIIQNPLPPPSTTPSTTTVSSAPFRVVDSPQTTGTNGNWFVAAPVSRAKSTQFFERGSQIQDITNRVKDNRSGALRESNVAKAAQTAPNSGSSDDASSRDQDLRKNYEDASLASGSLSDTSADRGFDRDDERVDDGFGDENSASQDESRNSRTRKSPAAELRSKNNQQYQPIISERFTINHDNIREKTNARVQNEGKTNLAKLVNEGKTSARVESEGKTNARVESGGKTNARVADGKTSPAKSASQGKTSGLKGNARVTSFFNWGENQKENLQTKTAPVQQKEAAPIKSAPQKTQPQQTERKIPRKVRGKLTKTSEQQQQQQQLEQQKQELQEPQLKLIQEIKTVTSAPLVSSSPRTYPTSAFPTFGTRVPSGNIKSAPITTKGRDIPVVSAPVVQQKQQQTTKSAKQQRKLELNYDEDESVPTTLRSINSIERNADRPTTSRPYPTTRFASTSSLEPSSVSSSSDSDGVEREGLSLDDVGWDDLKPTVPPALPAASIRERNSKSASLRDSYDTLSKDAVRDQIKNSSPSPLIPATTKTAATNQKCQTTTTTINR